LKLKMISAAYTETMQSWRDQRWARSGKK